jgi:hypothetical protein
MTAPVFNPDPQVILSKVYFKEVLSLSSPENRFGTFVNWGHIHGEPLPTDNTDLRYWTCVHAAAADRDVDLCYDATPVYDFIPYDPDPTAALPPEKVYPYGERRERIVITRKGNEQLKEVVLAQRTKADSQLFPQDGEIAVLADVMRIRSSSVVSARDQARLTAYAPIEAARAANMNNAEDMFAAIDAGLDFDIAAGWTPDASTWPVSSVI